ncbi:hypothetical protein SAMD00019534_096900 [Acytostelium subglobosum LB1]|uniref:hypothetical protein n=1 Tax=Acytostelium subglobosum LB1 TaxID=1410327 RepID=UPI000644CA91|nr:hypothetical protein SAMD00019534_096900 [Acytostelium subglobosum LB1]GAM26515.1 hypothetical protein SAMD00019534_096900 [Acytostelium subglobosum LB1]|eukprot:XP_012750611.1 hypothetical protein SAMD00019534_096900 [Acytostelium subglobosum LB1]
MNVMMMDTNQKIDDKDNNNNNERIKQLRTLVQLAVEECTPCDAILLSGGVDTSVLAETIKHCNLTPLKTAITVVCSNEARDGHYATEIAKRCQLEHHLLNTTLDDLLANHLEFAIKTLRTFDPMELRNSIVISMALRKAQELGCRTVMTGDAADELFAGYTFMHNYSEEKLAEYSQRLTRIMRFSSRILAAAMGMEIRQPYLDDRVIAFAKECTKSEKINIHDGTRHGKFILRQAFEDVAYSAWRLKEPIECGSGSTVMPAHLAAKLTTEELDKEKERVWLEDKIKIRDAEHLHYYRVFRKLFPVDDSNGYPSLVRFGDDPCPACSYQMTSREQNFCVICGHYPAR